MFTMLNVKYRMNLERVDVMKYESRLRSLSSFSFFIVSLYFVLNSILVIEWLNMQGTLSAFANVVFTVDCFTWHIYGIIALVGFVIRVVGKKERNVSSMVYIILHFLFMSVSFFEIFHMMQNAF